MDVSAKEQVTAALTFDKRYIERVTAQDLTAVRAIVKDSEVYEHIPTGKLKSMPYAAIGKLFSNTVHQDVKSCSAFFVRKNVIMTAAHCVMDPHGHWRFNLVMATHLDTPNLRFHKLTCVVVSSRWGRLTLDEALADDYAFIRVEGPDHPYLEIYRDKDYRGPLRIIGYPRAHAAYLTEATAPGGYTFNNQHPSVTYNANHGGRSGSPWITENGKVVSLTSHRDAKNRSINDGPRFTDRTQRMLRFASNKCRNVAPVGP